MRVETKKSRRRIIVLSSLQFNRWVEAVYSDHLIHQNDALPRAKNIIKSRNSKSGRSTHEVQPILFKWLGTKDPDNRWQRLTKDNGFCGILSDRLHLINLPDKWNLLFIENWEPFLSYLSQAKEIPVIAVYLGGNVSDVSLSAISRVSPKPRKTLHFGDYDWTGLWIFQRLKSFLPEAILYFPKNLEYYFQNFGQRKLAFSQPLPAGFNRNCPECRPVIRMIQQFNAGWNRKLYQCRFFNGYCFKSKEGC